MLIYTKLYKQLNTLNAMFVIMQQSILIGYISSEIIDIWYKKITMTQCLLNNVLQCKCNIVFTKLVTYHWSGIIFYLLWFDSVSKTIKYSCRLTHIGYISDEIINMWYRKITLKKDSLHIILQWKRKNRFSNIFSYLC